MSGSGALLLRFQIEQHLRSQRWTVGGGASLLVFGIVLLADRDGYSAWNDGVMIGTITALNFGVAADRRTGFDLFRSNFFTPAAVLMQKLAAASLLYIAYLLVAFVIAAVAWRDPQLALWYTCRACLVTGLIVPLALLIEITLGTTMPAVFAGFIAAVVLVVGVTKYRQPFIDFTGLETTHGSYASLSRLLVLNLTWNLAMAVAALGAWSYQHRRVRRRVRV